MTFELDANGSLLVRAIDSSTGRQAQAKMKLIAVTQSEEAIEEISSESLGLGGGLSGSSPWTRQSPRWIAVLDKVTHYELLGVQPDAGADALRHAYQGFAATFHPDAHMHRSREERASVNTIFKRGTEAYRVLSDPALRARYDDDQAGRSGGASAGSGAMPAAARASSTFPGARKTEAPKPGLGSNIAGRLKDFVRQVRARPFSRPRRSRRRGSTPRRSCNSSWPSA